MNLRNYFTRAILCFLIIASTACRKEVANFPVQEISSPTNYDLNSVSFLSSDLGFACGGDRFFDFVLLKTIDGGENWTEILLPTFFDPKELMSVKAHANGTVVCTGMEGLFYLSKDSGQTWQADRKTWNLWQDVDFKSPTEMSLCGGISFNTGMSQQISDPFVYQFFPLTEHSFETNDVDFPSAQIGYISGYGAILKTNDGGLNWEFTEAKNDHYRAMSWQDEMNGIALGREGTILKTADGGTNWKTIRSGNNPWNKKYRFYGVEENSRGELFAVGENGCGMYSQDRDNWKEIGGFGDTHLIDISFVDDDHCIIVGKGGKIFKVSL